MEKYTGKSKCSCGTRARYRAYNWNGQPVFACAKHMERLAHLADRQGDRHLSEADMETWARGHTSE